jgi:hypothetical protein
LTHHTVSFSCASEGLAHTAMQAATAPAIHLFMRFSPFVERFPAPRP